MNGQDFLGFLQDLKYLIRLQPYESCKISPSEIPASLYRGVPDENGRAEILSVLTRNLRIEDKFDLFKIVRFTPSFVGADLATLVSKAINLAIKRIIDKRRPQLRENVYWWRHPLSPEEIENPSITIFSVLLTNAAKSTPTKSGVNLAILKRSNLPSILRLRVSTDNISTRAFSSRRPKAISLSKRPGLLRAWSTASGLFVAPITRTMASQSHWQLHKQALSSHTQADHATIFQPSVSPKPFGQLWMAQRYNHLRDPETSVLLSSSPHSPCYSYDQHKQPVDLRME
ncbi:hypothetical protein M5K25_016925 [Dendrobium thyrsiflorum]|uniref:AAA ATPase AAA+ lid domain-containing protein n=1 Tax=Dendrobium thyrsiflorum TaxID=117978 RepID=A0ABD0USU5_DENTH